MIRLNVLTVSPSAFLSSFVKRRTSYLLVKQHLAHSCFKYPPTGSIHSSSALLFASISRTSSPFHAHYHRHAPLHLVFTPDDDNAGSVRSLLGRSRSRDGERCDGEGVSQGEQHYQIVVSTRARPRGKRRKDEISYGGRPPSSCDDGVQSFTETAVPLHRGLMDRR